MIKINKLAGKLGVDPQSLAKYLRCEQVPVYDTAARLRDKTGIPLDVWLGRIPYRLRDALEDIYGKINSGRGRVKDAEK